MSSVKKKMKKKKILGRIWRTNSCNISLVKKKKVQDPQNEKEKSYCGHVYSFGMPNLKSNQDSLKIFAQRDTKYYLCHFIKW